MKKKLKTLEESNAISWSSQNFDFNKPQLNGIECPNCKKELYDSQPMVTLTSSPAQKTTVCLNDGCGYTGYRYRIG